MHILVTNDDGIDAPGLLALAQAVKSLGKVTVLAPDRNWSVCGHTKTLSRPLRVKETTLSDGTPALSTDGTPSDCVALATLNYFSEAVDLVVAGINSAPNLGTDITYSGTVSCAIEAAIFKLPGIAFSLDVGATPADQVSYAAASQVAHRVTQTALREGLLRDVFLNVNIPLLPLEQIKGYRISRLGDRIYHDVLINRLDPQGKPYHWIGGSVPTGVPEPGTDIGDLSAGYVSITPLHLDMTAYHAQETLQSWNWNGNP